MNRRCVKLEEHDNDMDVKTAIETGNKVALRSLLSEDPALANVLIEWGRNSEIRTHPLHFVSDMLFGGTLQRGDDVPLIAELLEAGADPNHQAPNGETPLIGAASLSAEDVGVQLLNAGAQPNVRGGFQETALHWAAHLGLRRLVARLLDGGADVNLRDARYNSTPLGWAIHGRFSRPPGAHADHNEVAALLVAAGASVEPDWLADERVRSDPGMFAALSPKRP
jgi:ankyrin repeat protein